MSKFRFHIQAASELVTTDWEDEHVKVGHGTTAGERVAELRVQYGKDARIMVERFGDNRKPNILPRFRYKIKVKDDVYYSRAVWESELESALAEIRTMFPKGQITKEKVE